MKFILVLLFLSPFAVLSQSGSEIYLMNISENNGSYTLSKPLNISRRIGYDNQPFFDPKRSKIYFTSIQNSQADIWSFDYQKGKLSQITKTLDSEYSPTILPDGNSMACIVQRKVNGDQDLVKFSLQNLKKTSLILESKITGKVGYQAWLNKNEFITFILGEPNALHYHSALKDSIIAQNIGRSLHRIPNREIFSYVEEMQGTWYIKSFDPSTKELKIIAKGLEGSEQYNSWLNTNVIFVSKNDKIFAFNRLAELWSEVHISGDLPQKKISRMAIKGDKIALVVEE